LNIAYEQKDLSLIITISFLPMGKLWNDPRWNYPKILHSYEICGLDIIPQG